MKLRTSELTGAALDWAVAKAEGRQATFSPFKRWADTPKEEIAGWGVYLDPPERDEFGAMQYAPSTNWSQGGPIIEREHIGVCYYHEADGWEIPNWAAWRTDIDDRVQIMGETALIAAMRCFCSAKLGDEIDIPEELCQQRSS